MGKCEVTWDEYEIWMFNLDIQRRELNKVAATDREQAGRRRHPADQAVHRHDLRHGQGRLPGDLHDAAGGQDVLQVAQRQDRPLLPPADRGRMGIRLPGRHEDGLFVRRRRRQSWASTPGTSTTATRSITRSARRSRIPGACTTCTATWPNGRSISTFPTATDSWPARSAKNPWAIPTKVYPQAVRGGSWDDDPEQRCAAPRGAARTRTGSSKTRRFRRASGILPTRCSSASASCGRCTSPRDAEKAKIWDAGANDVARDSEASFSPTVSYLTGDRP